MSPWYGATAACAPPGSCRFGSRRRVTSAPRAASSASSRFLASSASASARAADRVLGFDGRGAEPRFVSRHSLAGSSARALRFPRDCRRGGAEGAAFSLLSITSASAVRILMLLPMGDGDGRADSLRRPPSFSSGDE